MELRFRLQAGSHDHTNSIVYYGIIFFSFIYSGTYSYLSSVIHPGAELQVASLIIEGEVLEGESAIMMVTGHKSEHERFFGNVRLLLTRRGKTVYCQFGKIFIEKAL